MNIFTVHTCSAHAANTQYCWLCRGTALWLNLSACLVMCVFLNTAAPTFLNETLEPREFMIIIYSYAR